MDKKTICQNIETASLEIEKLRIEATSKLNPENQKAEGQFFTPIKVANLVAESIQLEESKVYQILDPGAGIGSLAAALSFKIIETYKPQSIQLTLIEKDLSLIPYLKKTMRILGNFLSDLEIEFKFSIQNIDFFDLLRLQTGIEENQIGDFDLIVMNPPYGKINLKSSTRKALRLLGVDSPNLYSGFVTLSLKMLKRNGKIAAIVPRSFMNGPYFLEFRKDLLNSIMLQCIHLFDSRSSLFADTGVLQENVIISGTKNQTGNLVLIRKSVSHLENYEEEYFKIHQIVHPNDKEKFIRIPSKEKHESTVSQIESLTHSLDDLGIQVSTGRVVDFRARELTSMKASENDVPLIYPFNFDRGKVDWPKAKKKPQAINGAAINLLLPNQIYVLVKRFSSKEERRRVVAAIWYPKNFDFEYVGFENHLNVFHKNNDGLDRGLAKGLLIWLNSTVVDEYFRIFSGHTQVNATDLKSLKYPSLSQLVEIGRIFLDEIPSQEKIDIQVNTVLNWDG